MRTQQPGTEPRIGNCNYAIGVYAAINGVRSVFRTLDELADLVEFESGCFDATNVLDGSLLRNLPAGCIKCGSNNECYTKLDERDYAFKTR